MTLWERVKTILGQGLVWLFLTWILIMAANAAAGLLKVPVAYVFIIIAALFLLMAIIDYFRTPRFEASRNSWKKMLVGCAVMLVLSVVSFRMPESPPFL